MSNLLAFLPSIGIPEMIFLGVIALLLFGKRLPEVARSLGKGIVEFKKGLNGVEEEIERGGSYDSQAARPAPREERVETTAPRFEPPRTTPV